MCGEEITSDAQEAAPTQEIPTVVQPPPIVPVRRGNRTLAMVVGLRALLVSMVAVGAIVSLDLLGGETARRGGADPNPAAKTPSEDNSQDNPAQDEGPRTLGVGDSVETRGVKTTLNAVRILPTTDADQPIESPDNLFVATDLTFENTSEEGVAVPDLYEFTLQNEDGYSASQTTHTQQRPLLAEGELEPGAKTSGDLDYEVPPESKGLQLDYAPFSGEETYTWLVGDAS